MSVRILEGDALQVLQTLPDCSVQCCVTSPPYFGLRDYGVSGQLGLEKTPDLYVEAMVGVFREVKRVLRDDGTLWLNIGDSYAGSGKGGNPADSPHQKQKTNRGSILPAGLHESARLGGAIGRAWVPAPAGYKQKDLIGIPWMLAFALRDDGWYLRSDIIWHKPNPMPESVTDRPTKSHEYLFLLSKSPTYYYDAEAINEPSIVCGRQNTSGILSPKDRALQENGTHGKGGDLGINYTRTHRNKRSVWTVSTTPYREAHFATFPPDLIEPCILAGSAKQACEKCGAPWEREVERIGAAVKSPRSDYGHGAGRNDGGRSQLVGASSTTLGFKPTCDCENIGTGESLVLDPFGGAGTTGLVADRLGRDALLIELNPKYAEMARRRIHSDNPLFGDVA